MNHRKFQSKTMNELVKERHEQLKENQNELRKKWLPERYNPDINK
jgi:hypothetical protein